VTRALFPDWMTDAPCASVDPYIFFPPKGGSSREAKSICDSCDVKAECLAWAVANDEQHGVFGGLSARERRDLESPAAAYQCRTCDHRFTNPNGRALHERRHKAAA
jgi:hypothetical protein